MINFLKPWTHVAIGLPEIDFRLDVGITCDGVQQKFQHAEYFTRNPLTSPIVCHILQQCRCFLGTACNPCDEQIANKSWHELPTPVIGLKPKVFTLHMLPDFNCKTFSNPIFSEKTAI